MSRKTVLISRKNLKGIFSGVKRTVHKEVRFFADRGDTVYVAAEKIDRKEIKASGGIPVKTFRWATGGYNRRLSYMRAVQKAVDKLNPDLVIGHGDIVHQDICYIHNCVHLAYEKINGRTVPEDHNVARIHTQILKTQDFKVLICNSHLMKNDLTRRFNIPHEKVVVIHPSYDAGKFNLNDSGYRSEYRKKFGFRSEEVVVGLITSGDFKKRNLDLMIDAAKKLAEKGTPFNVLIAGNDKAVNFRNRIKELGIDDYFTFAPGISNVEAYYHCIDIFVLPALIEEFGQSVMEAMACGKPVIISDMVGCGELIEGESREFILPCSTPEVFSEKLLFLLENPEKRGQLSELNQVTAVKHSNKIRNQDFAELIAEMDL